MNRLRLLRTAARARQSHEVAMIDTCSIVRPDSSPGVLNAETGQYDPPSPSIVYAGKCQLLTPERSSTPDSDETENTQQRAVLKVPIGSIRFEIGDVAEVKKFGANDTPTADRYWRVIAVPPKRWQTHQALEAEEVVTRG